MADASAPYVEKARQGMQSMADAAMPWFQKATDAAREGAQKVADASAPYLQSAAGSASSTAAAHTNAENALNSSEKNWGWLSCDSCQATTSDEVVVEQGATRVQ